MLSNIAINYNKEEVKSQKRSVTYYERMTTSIKYTRTGYLLGSFSCQASIETQITTIGPRYRETVTRERYDDNLLYVYFFFFPAPVFFYFAMAFFLSLPLFFYGNDKHLTLRNGKLVLSKNIKYCCKLKYHVYCHRLFPRLISIDINILLTFEYI